MGKSSKSKLPEGRDADGFYTNPVTGQQKAYNAFLLQGSPGAGAAARDTTAWNSALNNWISTIAKTRGVEGDPMASVQESWFVDGGPGTPGVSIVQPASTALEKALLDKTMADYVTPALEADKTNKAKYQAILEKYKPAIDQNRELVNDMLTEDGNTGHSVLASRELENLSDAVDSSSGAIDARETAKIGDIDTALAEYLSQIDERKGSKLEALDPLLKERLNSAETAATSASLGEQIARDNITADLAAQGFVGGGSSFTDGAMARASIDARQAAAAAMGAAKEANARDVLGVNNESTDSVYDAKKWGTTGRFNAGNEATDSRFDLANWDANRKLAYLDADNTRRLSNLSTPFSLTQDEIKLDQSVDDAGWAGLQRSLDTLNWWKLDNANHAPVSTAPTPTYEVSPSIWASVGPSLTNAGLSIAKGNNWWSKK